MILRLVEPTSGEIRLLSRPLTGRAERIGTLEFRRLVQPIFQNPFEAFSAYLPVETYLRRTALNLKVAEHRRRGRRGRRPGVALGRPRPRPDARQVHAPVLRRRAAAHQRRPGADPKPQAHRRRRAGQHGRRLAADEHRQPVPPDRRGEGRVVHLHHPRPLDRLLPLRPRLDHEDGAHRRAGQAGGDPRPSDRRLHPRADGGDPDHRRALERDGSARPRPFPPGRQEECRHALARMPQEPKGG